jgi:uncharacterized protein (TIGR02246 family)
MSQLKRKILVAAFLLLLMATGRYVAPSIAETETREQQMIEKLHQQDVAATLAGDPKALADLWTDDAVRLEPGGQAEFGKQLIRTQDEKQKAAHPEFKVLTYAPDIKEIKIVEGWAFEWGYFSSSYKDTPDGQAKSFRGKMLRVLRKQGDGSWKFARVMWNMAE